MPPPLVPTKPFWHTRCRRWGHPPHQFRPVGVTGQINATLRSGPSVSIGCTDLDQDTWATRLQILMSRGGPPVRRSRTGLCPCFAARETAKSRGHGLPAHRPPSAGYDPGTSPPRAGAAPSGPAQKRDNETHRPVKSTPGRDVTDRGPPWAGRERSPRGSGWPPINGIARIRIRE